jgi:hypothetical protein
MVDRVRLEFGSTISGLGVKDLLAGNQHWVVLPLTTYTAQLVDNIGTRYYDGQMAEGDFITVLFPAYDSVAVFMRRTRISRRQLLEAIYPGAGAAADVVDNNVGVSTADLFVLGAVSDDEADRSLRFLRYITEFMGIPRAALDAGVHKHKADEIESAKWPKSAGGYPFNFSLN